MEGPASASTDLHAEYAVAERRIALLRRSPQVFAHPAGRIEWIETHISWVLLAGDFAYKFKKPLQLDFLDFSTVALRRAACEEELRINRRTAPAMYLGLVGLHHEVAAEALWFTPLCDAANDAEPAVQMRRFGQEALFGTALDLQKVLPVQVDLLARHVAQFHASAAIAAPGLGWGTAPAVRAPVDACLTALRDVVAMALPAQAPLLDQLAAWFRQQGDALAPVFDDRLTHGRVRECHGDLHLANIALIDGHPQLFDAIEFNPALRWIDGVADIAFVVMDLTAHGRSDLAWRFVNLWLEYTGDYHGLRVLRYYCAYRALVRARVAGMQWVPRGDAGSGGAAVRTLQQYLALAAEYAGVFAGGLPTIPNASLWMAHGFSGAGKSTHTLALACQRGMVRVRADVERKRLFGLLPEAQSDAVPGGIYTPDATRRTRDRLAQVACDALSAGFSVIVDATFLNSEARSHFVGLAGRLGVPCRILSFEAPLEVLRDRVRGRSAAGGDASEASVAVLDAQWASASPLLAAEELITLHVDTTRPVDWDVLLPRVGASPVGP